MHDSAGIVTTQAVGASQDFWDLLKSQTKLALLGSTLRFEPLVGGHSSSVL